MTPATETKADRDFRERLSITRGGCWEWTGARNHSGYGILQVEGRSIRAHRFAYERYVGPIPDGMVVCHSCDNPGCARPSHLWVGTQGENTADREAKGRGATRSRNGAAKLTDDQYIQIERRAAAGEGCAALGRDFGVTHQAIRAYLKRRAGRAA